MRLILILCVSVMLLSWNFPSPLPAQSNLVPVTTDNQDQETSVGVTAANVYETSPALAMLDWLVFRYENVNFSVNSYDLMPAARTILERKARWINNQDPATQLVVVGHCDQRGTDEYNIRLGAKRADAVKQFLVSVGVAPERVRIVSVGKWHPLVQGEGETIWAMNRRAEVMKP